MRDWRWNWRSDNRVAHTNAIRLYTPTISDSYTCDGMIRCTTIPSRNWIEERSTATPNTQHRNQEEDREIEVDGAIRFDSVRFFSVRLLVYAGSVECVV